MCSKLASIELMADQVIRQHDVVIDQQELSYTRLNREAWSSSPQTMAISRPSFRRRQRPIRQTSAAGS